MFMLLHVCSINITHTIESNNKNLLTNYWNCGVIHRQ